MPANGLTYAPPHACGCYMEAKLYGFWAVAAERENWQIDPQADVLEKGPAYGDTPVAPDSAEDQWPTLRGDARRSGITDMPLPDKPAKLWRTKLGTRLSSPVAAGGLVLVAEIDSGTVYALDAAGGERKWAFATGSRVDSPPTIHGGTAIFGGRDGWVYCLRAADGQLVWRFRAAPADLRTVDMDRVESLWPVAGSVLLQNGLVYCCAGRNTYLDDGLFLYALDPATGEVVHRRQFKSERPEIFSPEEAEKLRTEYPGEKISQNTVDFRTFAAPDRSDSFSMDGNLNDVATGDGEHVFLRHLTFDRQWQRLDEMLPHLFSTSCLTDDNENHRSHWCIGRGFFGRTIYAYPWIPERFGSQLNYPVGLMFVYKDRQAWGIQRAGSGVGRYTLFSKGIPKYVAHDPAYKNDLIRTGGNWGFHVDPAMRPHRPARSVCRLRGKDRRVAEGLFRHGRRTPGHRHARRPGRLGRHGRGRRQTVPQHGRRQRGLPGGGFIVAILLRKIRPHLAERDGYFRNHNHASRLPNPCLRSLRRRTGRRAAASALGSAGNDLLHYVPHWGFDARVPGRSLA